MRFSTVFILLIALCTTACTTIQVTPLEPSLAISKVCIEVNSKVIVGDFLPVITSGFKRHGISTEIYSSVPDDECEVILTYTALQSWDLTPFLSHAELWLNDRSGNQIAYAKFHLEAKGGFDFSKWDSTEEKMNPVIDQLLAGYK